MNFLAWENFFCPGKKYFVRADGLGIIIRAGMLKHKQWTLKHAKYWVHQNMQKTLAVKACILRRTLKHAKLVYHL